jgi:hypothetical protein
MVEPRTADVATQKTVQPDGARKFGWRNAGAIVAGAAVVVTLGLMQTCGKKKPAPEPIRTECPGCVQKASEAKKGDGICDVTKGEADRDSPNLDIEPCLPLLAAKYSADDKKDDWERSSSEPRKKGTVVTDAFLCGTDKIKRKTMINVVVIEDGVIVPKQIECLPGRRPVTTTVIRKPKDPVVETDPPVRVDPPVEKLPRSGGKCSEQESAKFNALKRTVRARVNAKGSVVWGAGVPTDVEVSGSVSLSIDANGNVSGVNSVRYSWKKEGVAHSKSFNGSDMGLNSVIGMPVGFPVSGGCTLSIWVGKPRA